MAATTADAAGFQMDDLDPITLRAWQCVIPCEVLLEQEQRRINFIVPKQGYIFHSCKNIFPQLFSTDPGAEVFFRFSCTINGKDVHIPMQYPMCVIFDYLTAIAPPNYDLLAERALKLKLHTSDNWEGLPVLQLQFGTYERYGDLEIAQRHKMACMLRYRSITPRFSLDSASIKDINESIRNNDVRLFFKQYAKIKGAGERQVNDETDRYVAPVVFHVKHTKVGDADQVLPVIRKVPFLQLPTLGSALRHYFPCCYDLTDAMCTSAETLPPEMGIVLVMGAQPSLGTPIEFLMEHLTCVDCFVHVVVIPKAPNTVRRRPVCKDIADDEMDDANEDSDAASENDKFEADEGRLRSPTAEPMSAKYPENATFTTEPSTVGSELNSSLIRQPTNDPPVTEQTPVAEAAPAEEKQEEPPAVSDEVAGTKPAAEDEQGDKDESATEAEKPVETQPPDPERQDDVHDVSADEKSPAEPEPQPNGDDKGKQQQDGQHQSSPEEPKPVSENQSAEPKPSFPRPTAPPRRVTIESSDI